MRIALVAAAALVVSACGDVADEPRESEPLAATLPVAPPAPVQIAPVPKSPLADFDVLDAPITPPPAWRKLDPFYAKHTDAAGIPVLASAKVSDLALLVARTTVLRMLVKRSDVKEALVDADLCVVVMAREQVITDVPELRDIGRFGPPKGGGKRNERRGIFVRHTASPLAVCAEENLLREDRDTIRGDNCLVHEIAHAIDRIGLRGLPKSTFAQDLARTYAAAMGRRLWTGAYAATDEHEYWADGACAWFDANGAGRKPIDSPTNVCTRAELREYDIELASLLSDVFPADDLGLATTK